MKHLKKYWSIYFYYIILVAGIVLIMSQNSCASKFDVLRSDGAVVIKKKKVRMWTGPDCYYCDKAKEFFKKNKIEYVERNFDCEMCRNELFKLANKLKFGTSRIDGVPVIVIDENKIIVGYSPEELTCLLLNRGCSKRVYNRYLDAIKIKK